MHGIGQQQQHQQQQQQPIISQTVTTSPNSETRVPTDLKLLRTTDAFHHQLKTYLFESVYGHRETED